MLDKSPILDTLKQRQWPTLVVGRFSRFEIIFLALFYIFCLIFGWYNFTHMPRAAEFLIVLTVPVALLLLKNRMFFIALLIATQFILAFWCIGNAGDVVNYTSALFLALFTLSGMEKGYYAMIASIFLFFTPVVQGYELVHLVGFIMVIVIFTHREEMIGTEMFRKHFYNRLMFVMLLYITLSLFWCQDLLSMSYSYYNSFTLFIFYWVTVVFLKNEERLFSSLKIWIIAGLGYAIVRTIFQPKPVPGESEAVFFTSKNTISSLINFSIFTLLPVITLKAKRIPTFLLYTALIILLAVNYGIGSRAGFGGLIIGIIIYLFIVSKKELTRFKRFTLKFFTAFIILFLIACIFLVPLLFMHLHLIRLPLPIPAEYSTILFRFEQWDYGRQMLEENHAYLFGLGLSGYSTLYSSYYPPGTEMTPWQNHPHSIYVHVFCDFGIIGYLIFTALMISVFLVLHKFILTSRNIPLKILAAALYAGIFSFLIHGLVDWSLMEMRLWVFVGMSIALPLIDRSQNYKSVPFPSSKSGSPF